MVTIDANGQLCTLVVMMHVDPALIDEKMRDVRALAHEHSKHGIRLLLPTQDP